MKRKTLLFSASALLVVGSFSASLISSHAQGKRQAPTVLSSHDGTLDLIESQPNQGARAQAETTAAQLASQNDASPEAARQHALRQQLKANNTPELIQQRRAALTTRSVGVGSTSSNNSLGRSVGDRVIATTEQEMPGCRIDPASPSVGTDIPATYFGPAPSTVQKELIGPLQLLTAGELNREAGTITLPLYTGQMRNGKQVYYILTDTTDQANAAALGLNFSAKLNYSDTGNAVRTATLQRGGMLTFNEGEVDFSPVRKVTPGPANAPFPPTVAEPGSIGDSLYTPLVRITNAGNHIYNAPVIAFGVARNKIHFPNGKPDYSLVSDQVLSIDTVRNVVTMRLAPGFSFARPVLYLSTESSDPLVAALEDNTFAPALNDIDTGNDDSAFSATERLFLTINGPVGCGNPQRQGMFSALTDGRAPLNVLGGIPTVATDYSPMWDLNIGVWTANSIEKQYRSRVNEEFQILALAEGGFITGPGGGSYGSVGIIVNCPIVFRFL